MNQPTSTFDGWPRGSPPNPLPPDDNRGQLTEHDKFMRKFYLFAIIYAASITFFGMMSEANCDYNCIIAKIFEAFGRRGGNRKTRGGRDELSLPTLPTRKSATMKRRSAVKSPGSGILPRELLNLNVGSDAIIQMKEWISANISNVKDEKTRRLVNKLLKKGEKSLSKTKMAASSPQTVRQFIAKNKEEFIDYVRDTKL
jgi:hypothetical protein